ncbi:MAG: hypothetical protein EOP32_33850 [Rhodococcus sp. (in: high G+C Gram-positive bacteria)]|nr:MAG: hypothetical protein EOP32_33850 [Rhodococcus sp. (in: high G+C Gram-positive bacteria)]
MDGDGYVGHHSTQLHWQTIEGPDDHVLEPLAFDVDHEPIVRHTGLLGAAQLLGGGTAHWNGTLITVFQPAEAVGECPR